MPESKLAQPIRAFSSLAAVEEHPVSAAEINPLIVVAEGEGVRRSAA